MGIYPAGGLEFWRVFKTAKCPNESNHELSWTLVGIDRWIPSTSHKLSRNFVKSHDINLDFWHFMVFHGISWFHFSSKIFGGQKPWNLCQLLSKITNIREKRSKLISRKFVIIREWSWNPVIRQFQFTRGVCNAKNNHLFWLPIRLYIFGLCTCATDYIASNKTSSTSITLIFVLIWHPMYIAWFELSFIMYQIYHRALHIKDVIVTW